MKTDEDGVAIAEQIWNLFLGGNGVRPFGDGVVMDGVDLWMRDNQVAGYSALVNRLKELYGTDPSRKYYMAGKYILHHQQQDNSKSLGSPRCSFPEPLFADPNAGPFITLGGSKNFDYLSIHAESSPDCSFLNRDLFLGTMKKWSDWAGTAGKGDSRIPLYLGIPANNFVSAPGDYISIQAAISTGKYHTSTYMYMDKVKFANVCA